jgi:hypothetical protein
MMRKLIPLTALVLGLSGGVALADRDHGRGGDHNRGNTSRVVVRSDNHRGNTVVVRDHRGDNHNRGNDGYRGNNNYRGNGNYRGNYGGRVVVNTGPRYHGGGYVRRPIYVSRPVIRHRYYNYYQRPSLIVESYNPMAGYDWVPGSWSWSGYEWVWQPGHYEPDASYIDSAYGYDGY